MLTTKRPSKIKLKIKKRRKKKLRGRKDPVDVELQERYLQPRVLTAPAAVWKRENMKNRGGGGGGGGVEKNTEPKPHLSRIDMMLHAFDFNDDDDDDEEKKWGRRTPTSVQQKLQKRRPPSRQRGLFPTHLNSSSSFMPPTVPRSMTPRKRHPAEKRILKRTNSSASAGRREKKKAVWVSRPRSRHRPPSQSLFLRLPPKNGRKGGISEDRTSSKTKIIWGDEDEDDITTRRRPKLSTRKKKRKKKKKKKNIHDDEDEDDKEDEEKKKVFDDEEKSEDKNEEKNKDYDAEESKTKVHFRPKSPIKMSINRRKLKSRDGTVPTKIKRLGRRRVVSRRKHKSGKIQLLLLTDSSDSSSDEDTIVERRVSPSTIIHNGDENMANSVEIMSEKSEDAYEDGLETTSLDHGFLSLFANQHGK